VKSRTAAKLTAFTLLSLIVTFASGTAWAQKAKPLPYSAREAMKEFDQTVRSVDSSLKLLATLRSDSNTQTDQIERKVKEIEDKIAGLQPLLDKAQAEAAAKGVSAHPDFDAAQAKIASAAEKFAGVRTETLKQTAEEKATAARKTPAPEKPAEDALPPILFSTAPIAAGKPSRLSTSFKAGERIYGLIVFTDQIRKIAGVGEAESDNAFEVKVWVDGEPESSGGTSLTMRKDALVATTFVLDIAPDPEKMTAYSDPSIIWPEKFEKEGKRAGPMQLTKLLSNLPAGKHTVKIVLYRYQDLAAGEFAIEGDFASYAQLWEGLDGQAIKGVNMPQPAMSDRVLEGEMEKLIRGSTHDLAQGAREGKILQVAIIDPDWQIERHPISGVILFRYIRAEVGFLATDGTAWIQRFVFKQEFVGDAYQPTAIHGYGDKRKTAPENLR
jgi:hypothetical protein